MIDTMRGQIQSTTNVGDALGLGDDVSTMTCEINLWKAQFMSSLAIEDGINLMVMFVVESALRRILMHGRSVQAVP